MERKSISVIDHFRFIAAIMVIGIHTFPLATIDRFWDSVITRGLFRIAVPFFIITTGYFLSSSFQKRRVEKIKHTIIKVGGIYLLGIIGYLPLLFYQYHSKQFTLPKMDLWLPINLVKVFCFDAPVYHFWYFPALIIGLIITWFLTTQKHQKAMIIAGCLYLIGLLGDSYYGLVRGTFLESGYQMMSVFSTYTRNGIFYVPLFLVLGIFYANKRSNKTLLFTSFILFLGEILLVQTMGLAQHDSMYFFLPFFVIELFNYLLTLEKPIIHFENLDYRRISLWMYLIHLYVIVLVRFSAKPLKMEGILVHNSLLHFIVVTGISFVCAYLCSKCLKNHSLNKRVV